MSGEETQAKPKRAPRRKAREIREAALANAAAIVAEHYPIAAIVVPEIDVRGGDHMRIVPVGHQGMVDLMLQDAAVSGEPYPPHERRPTPEEVAEMRASRDRDGDDKEEEEEEEEADGTGG